MRSAIAGRETPAPLQPEDSETMFGDEEKNSKDAWVQQVLAGLSVWAALLIVCALFF